MTHDHDPPSRRALLRAALAATASTAGAAALADCSADPPLPPTTDADAMTLNRMLGAEHRLVKVYDAAAAVLRSPPVGDPEAARALVYAEVTTRWRQHHRDHATALTAAVRAAHGMPVDEAAATFAPPEGFTPSVVNALKLLANEERAAAVALNEAIGALSATQSRFLASAVEGDEAQHFAVLYLLVRQLVDPGARFISNASTIVPVAFVSSVSSMPGLQSVPNLTYMAM